MAPELAGVDVAGGVDVGELAAGGAAAVHGKQLPHFGGALGGVLGDAVSQVDSVSVIIGGENLHRYALRVERFSLIRQPRHHGPPLRRRKVAGRQGVAPAGIDEVIEAEPRDAVVYALLQNLRQVGEVVLGDREAHPGAQARGLGGAEALPGGDAGGGAPAEAVVRFRRTVDGDADVLEAGLAESDRDFGRDQSAIGGKDGAETAGGGVGAEVKEVVAEEGLAAGEEEHGRAEAGEVVDEGFGLGGRRVASVRFARGVVAVGAVQVAGGGHVPHDQRPVGGGELQEVWVWRPTAHFAKRLRDGGFAAEEFGEADHFGASRAGIRLAVTWPEIALTKPGIVYSSASTATARPSSRAVSAGNGADDRGGDVAKRLEADCFYQRAGGGGTGEGEEVGSFLGEKAGEEGQALRVRFGAVDVEDFDVGAAGDQRLGENGACFLCTYEQDARRGNVGEFPGKGVSHRARRDEIGTESGLVQRLRGARADGGELAGVERAPVEVGFR